MSGSRTTLWALLMVGSTAVLSPARADTRPMEVDDLLRMHRVSDPQVSPDGRRVVFVVTDALLAENATASRLWEVGADGRHAQWLTSRRANCHDEHPRWSPNGRWITFQSDRGGGSQVWVLPSDGGDDPVPLTALSTGAGDPVWSPDGGRLAFASLVFPEFDGLSPADADRANGERLAELAREPGRPRLVTELLYRHWDRRRDGRRIHVFTASFRNGGLGVAADATPGDRDAQPISALLDSGEECALSPDGRTLVCTEEPLPTRENAWSTGVGLVRVDLPGGGSAALTGGGAAAGRPLFAPDGRRLAYRAQARPGVESDRWTIWILDRVTGSRRCLTAGLDLSVDRFEWSPDGQWIYFEVKRDGGAEIWRVQAGGGTDGEVGAGAGAGAPKMEQLVTGGVNRGVAVAPDGRWIAYVHESMTEPAEIERLDLASGRRRRLTGLNAGMVADLDLTRPESVTVAGEGGVPVQMWVVKPPGFDAGRKYPLVFWVHGGPEGAFEDGWSYRWNPQVWAAQGYVVALPNPRGSFGFGQAYTDGVAGDWGGKVYGDLIACVDWLERRPWVDSGRMAAAGASFGGYMMSWFEGHTNRFKALVTHGGVYNFDSMYGTTDELWFEEWEQGVPWMTKDFDRFSPHRFAAAFRTPDLVIHNERDYRVPISEGMQLFTALQRRGVPSEFLSFPDEGHEVLKPRNCEVWHQTIFAWLARYTGGGAVGPPVLVPGQRD